MFPEPYMKHILQCVFKVREETFRNIFLINLRDDIIFFTKVMSCRHPLPTISVNLIGVVRKTFWLFFCNPLLIFRHCFKAHLGNFLTSLMVRLHISPIRVSPFLCFSHCLFLPMCVISYNISIPNTLIYIQLFKTKKF